MVDNKKAYVVPMLGRAAFENLCAVENFGTDKVVIIIGDDRQAAPLYLYIGEKNATPLGDYEPPEFLVRNGLGNGNLYVWVEPDTGQVFFLDQQMNGMGKLGLRKIRARVGLIFQRHNLVPRLTVLTNVVHGAMGRRFSLRTWFQGLAPKDVREEAMACLEKVGLAHLASSRADKLSGGESQRVAIARALMQRPQFMMADEPAASLDPKIGREVMELFVGLTRQENITLLFVSHDLEHALHYSDRLIGLKNGEMVLDQDSSCLSKIKLKAIYE